MVNEAGFAVMLKSTTWTVMVSEWVSDPLVAVTVTV